MNNISSQPALLATQQSRNSTSSRKTNASTSTKNFLNKVKEKLSTTVAEDDVSFDAIGAVVDEPVMRSKPSKSATASTLVSSENSYNGSDTSIGLSPKVSNNYSTKPKAILNRLLNGRNMPSMPASDLIPELPYSRSNEYGNEMTETDASNFTAISARDKYINELKTWKLTQKLNQNQKPEDPILYASERLTSFIETYELILLRQRQTSHSIESEVSQTTQTTVSTATDKTAEPKADTLPPGRIMKELKFTDPTLSEKIDLLGFWSLSALKKISDAHNFVTKKLLRDFANYDLKDNERMKIFNVQGEIFGLQWSWQLGIDNPDSDIYDVSISPTIPINFKKLVGPPNIISQDNENLHKLSFKDNRFTMAMSYDLWLHLREDEWDPVVKEMYRVLAPPGFVHFFLCDFEIVGCINSKYNKFFKRVQTILKKNGMDPHPSKHIIQKLKDAGFVNVCYSCVSLKKGMPNNMGYLIEFLQGYLEFIIFDKISRLQEMTAEDLQEFRELKAEYHEGLRNGDMMNEFGSQYCTFVFAQKK